LAACRSAAQLQRLSCARDGLTASGRRR
jgi:hypothetical protein